MALKWLLHVYTHITFALFARYRVISPNKLIIREREPWPFLVVHSYVFTVLNICGFAGLYNLPLACLEEPSEMRG